VLDHVEQDDGVHIRKARERPFVQQARAHLGEAAGMTELHGRLGSLDPEDLEMRPGLDKEESVGAADLQEAPRADVMAQVTQRLAEFLTQDAFGPDVVGVAVPVAAPEVVFGVVRQRVEQRCPCTSQSTARASEYVAVVLSIPDPMQRHMTAGLAKYLVPGSPIVNHRIIREEQPMSRVVVDSLSLTAIALILSVGQLLFKFAALRLPAVDHLRDLRHLLGDPLLWLALILYGVATLLWIFMLQRVALMHAYPFAALAFVLVPIGASTFFGERLSGGVVIGTGLIVLGICVTVVSAPRG
jgi:multidrug transporter EmrE-like cation transporter